MPRHEFCPALAQRAPPAARRVSLVLVLAIGACQPVSIPVPHPRAPETLNVLVRAGPTSWFTGPDARLAGFDHDLLERFAAGARLPLVPTMADASLDVLDAVSSGVARVAVGGLYRPVPGTRLDGVSATSVSPVLWTHGYYTVEPVVITAADGYKPRSLRDLAGEEVAFLAWTGIEQALETVRASHPEIRWKPVALASADALIGEVDTGQIEYAIVASHQAAAARNLYLNFDVAFSIGAKLELAWVLSPGQEKLRDEIDAFIERSKKDGTIERFADRYFSRGGDVERIDAGIFQDRLRELLPAYRRHFEEAQDASGVEWRLLAAVAYQESQWDPVATSETGVRGMMQLTEETARHLGVADRLDPRASVLAAARYLRDLKAKLPARIAEPDRTWLALAAFNIGLGHLEDARVLAQRQKLNPDVWSDVKKALPLLAEPEYYEQAKLGYARGGMPVAFVDRVRAYYDILVRQERAHQPRLQLQATRDER